MKPSSFRYEAPASVEEALAALAQTGSDAKVLAGGQSLIPLLNMRLAAPARLVDINGIAELDVLECGPAGVRVGALARHARVERSAGVARVQPLLGQALRNVAHPVVRNRGTVVGSLAHADPAAEMPAVLALLGGTMELLSASGHRTVPASEFFTGPLESTLRPDELAVAAVFPALPDLAGTSFAEIARRHGDYGLVGAGAVVVLDEDLRIASARVGYLGVAATPLFIDLTEAVGGGGDWAAGAAQAGDLVEPEGDIHASAEYRRRLTQVLTERVLREAAAAARQRGSHG